VIANNAGGMRCTVQKDAYHTVSALTFVTPSGAVIDTSRPDAEKEFALAEPQLAEGLLELRRELLADAVLTDRTRRKYAIRTRTVCGSVLFSTVKRRSGFFDASSSARGHTSVHRRSGTGDDSSATCDERGMDSSAHD